MPEPITARPPYQRRPGPPQAYTPAWFQQEFQNLMRSIPPMRIRTVAVDDRVSVGDDTLAVDATNGPVTITLLPPDQVLGLTVTIKKVDASGNAVTIAGTVDGVMNPTLAAQYDSLTIQAYVTEWLRIATI